jgi:lipopolysaccharide transport system ATP-binding protein
VTAPARTVIDVRNVGKAYRRAAGGSTASLRNLGELRARTTHWALRDISLTIREGEALGVIGVNGAGKSTLLRLMSGVTAPTRGSIHLYSTISGLLTLGESFQPVLSGEENALTAAILGGLTQRQARKRLQRIAEFAELEHVLHQPLRTYSDGMKLRLAFAVAIHVEPRVLLIDEVLAVGDLRFRQKCLGRLAELHDREAVTVILTSHDLEQVERLCDRAIWLADGVVAADGPPADITRLYRQSLQASIGEISTNDRGVLRSGDGRVEIAAVRMNSVDGEATMIVRGEPLVIEVDVVVHEPVEEVVFGISGYGRRGDLCFDLATAYDKVVVGPLTGKHTLRLTLHRVDLSPGPYTMDLGVYAPEFAHVHDFHGGAYTFEVMGDPNPGVLDPPRQWQVT